MHGFSAGDKAGTAVRCGMIRHWHGWSSIMIARSCSPALHVRIHPYTEERRIMHLCQRDAQQNWEGVHT